MVCDFFKKLPGKKLNIFLAGGVFANVKLNQRIKDLKNISNVYVFPNMGDGGLSIGAAQLAFIEKEKKLPHTIKGMLTGNDINEKN